MAIAAGKVIVVDDDDSVRRSLRRLLTGAGYEVEEFASAEEFLDHAIGNTVNNSLGFALKQCFLTTNLSLLGNDIFRHIMASLGYPEFYPFYSQLFSR